MADQKTIDPVAAARNAVAEGEAIVAKAGAGFDLGALRDDGPLMRAWQRGAYHPEHKPPPQVEPAKAPLLKDAIAMVRRSIKLGRRITAGLGLAQVRRQVGEDDWPAFAAKHFRRIDTEALIGRVVHRGGIHRCQCCGTEVVSRCECGDIYVSAGHEKGHEKPKDPRGRKAIGDRPLSAKERKRRSRKRQRAAAAASTAPVTAGRRTARG